MWDLKVLNTKKGTATFENTISPNTFFLEANSVQLRLIEAIKHKS